MNDDAWTVELTFEVRDDDCFFVTASAALATRVVGEATLARRDGNRLAYFTLDATPDAVRAMAADQSGIEGYRIVTTDERGCLLEVIVEEGRCVSGTLAATHAVVSEAYAEDGVGIVVAEVPSHADPTAVVDAMVTHHPGTRLLAKRQREDGSMAAVRRTDGAERYLSTLTTKQRDAVRTAVEEGYLAWPRRASAEECAAALNISQPTFSQHLYRGLELLLGGLFEAAAGETERRPGRRDLSR